jgi:predicted amidophosphoribosyltransferase
VRDLIGVLLPSKCLICGQPPQLCCESCRPTPKPHRLERPGLIGYAGIDYSVELAALLNAYKDRGQLWLEPELAAIAAGALRHAAEFGTPDFYCYLPSSLSNYRARGYNPALRLLRAARPDRTVPVLRVLRWQRSVLDQSKLGADERLENLSGSLSVSLPSQVRPARTVLFDDVLTTGATARAAVEALEAAGAQVSAVCVLADVRQRFPPSGNRAYFSS